MTCLIISGNVNLTTFVNAIIAANTISINNFQCGLSKIEVLHSKQSFEAFGKAWFEPESKLVEHLALNKIQEDLFNNRLTTTNNTSTDINWFVDILEEIVSVATLKSNNIIIDITNGTSYVKNLLSLAAYVLDIDSLYALDTIKMKAGNFDMTQYQSAENLFQLYCKTPSNISIDKLGYLNSVDIIRYKKITTELKTKFLSINKNIDADSSSVYFEKNLLASIDLKMKSDKSNDAALFRIVSSSIGGSIEELLWNILKQFSSSPKEELTLGQKINELRKLLEPFDFDTNFFDKINDLFLYIRNNATHHKGGLTDTGKISSDLLLRITIPYIQYYTDVVYPTLKNQQNTSTLTFSISNNAAEYDEEIYVGIDGDNTGNALVDLLSHGADDKTLHDFSNEVTNAVKAVSNYAKTHLGAKIIFAAGDDILLKGKFKNHELMKLKKMFEDKSKIKCCISYGRNVKEVFLAMKLAKASAAKNTIKGVCINEKI